MFCLKSMIILTGILATFPVFAEISTDGSFGAAVSLRGPAYNIDAELGKQVRGNLYHGFHKFDLDTGEQAVFKGSGTVENIIGKISGGQSHINGLIKSEISGANLFLINPQGMIFGPDAALDIRGSFYVSSYDMGQTRQLSGNIEFQGSEIRVADGKSISAAADNIRMSDAVLKAENGSIFIIANRFFAKNSVLNADAVGSEYGGEIAIHAAEIKGQNIRISSDAVGSGNGGNITISGIDDAPAQSVLFSDGSQIAAGSLDRGNAGTISIFAQSLHLTDSAFIASEAFGAGNGGKISLHVNHMKAERGSGISSESVSDGNGGNLMISGIGKSEEDFADFVTFSGKYPVGEDVVIAPESDPKYFSRIYAETRNSGNAGNITIYSKELSLSDEAFIRSRTSGSGSGGNIGIYADFLKLSDNAGINSDTLGQGAGGHISIRSQNVAIINSHISADTGSAGKGGSLSITGYSEKEPAESVKLSDGASIFAGTLCGEEECSQGGNADKIIILSKLLKLSSAYIGSETYGAGSGGDIHVGICHLDMTDGSEITVKSKGKGMGGKIRIAGVSDSEPADTIILTGNTYKSIIYAGSESSGEAGTIRIYANTMRLSDGASVSTSARNADGGDIDMTIPHLFYLNHAEITTSVGGGLGNGGNIRLYPDLAVMNHSEIIADAHGGNGGNIYIVANRFIASPQSRVSASSELGIDGQIEIDANETDMMSNLAILPTSFQDVSIWMRDPCQGRNAGNIGSLLIKGREGMPDEPEDFLR